MSQTLLTNATTVISSGQYTGNAWNNPGNLLLNAGYASTPGVNSLGSDVVIGNFNFLDSLGNPIDSNASISGIEIIVTAERGLAASPATALEIYAYDNTNGNNFFYLLTPVFSGFTTAPVVYTFGSSSYLFGTTWTGDQVNNIKLRLQGNGQLSVKNVQMRVYFTNPTVNPNPPAQNVCGSLFQCQPFSLIRPVSALTGDVNWLVDKFQTSDGQDIVTGDITAPGIPVCIDEGTSNEENVYVTAVTTTAGNQRELLVTRGWCFRDPFGIYQDTTLLRQHGGGSTLEVSNTIPFYDIFLRKCHIGTLVNQVIRILYNGALIKSNPKDLDFRGEGVTVISTGGDNTRETITDRYVRARISDTTSGYLDDKIELVGSPTVTVTKTITNPGANEKISYSMTATGGGGGMVQTVSGLDTDNTDPANPVVQIAVDGITITGTGTALDPLVSVGGTGNIDSINGDTTAAQVLDNTDTYIDITQPVAGTNRFNINLPNLQAALGGGTGSGTPITVQDEFYTCGNILSTASGGNPYSMDNITGTIGDLNWNGQSSSATKDIAKLIDSQINHNGIIRVGNSYNSTITEIYLGNYEEYSVSNIVEDGMIYRTIIAPNIVATGGGWSMFEISEYLNNASDYIRLTFDETTGNYIFETKDASTAETTSIGAYVLDDWYEILFKVVGTSVQCWIGINGAAPTLIATHSTNIPTALTQGNPRFGVKNTNDIVSAETSLDIDYFSMYDPTANAKVNQGGDVTQAREVSLTSADILGLTDFELIPAPGTGKLVIVDQVIYSYTHITTPYTFTGVLRIDYTGNTTELVNPVATTMLTNSASIITSCYPLADQSDNVVLTAGIDTSVSLTLVNAAPTGGDGTLKIFIKYRTITL